jgi:hypothetical protein
LTAAITGLGHSITQSKEARTRRLWRGIAAGLDQKGRPFRQIGASGESLAVAGQHDRSNADLRAKHVENLDAFLAEASILRIDGRRRDRHCRDVIFDLDAKFRDLFESFDSHFSPPKL